MNDLKEALTHALEHPIDPTLRHRSKQHLAPKRRASTTGQDSSFPDSLIWTVVGSLVGLAIAGLWAARRPRRSDSRSDN